MLVLISLLFLIKATQGDDDYRSLIDGWTLQNGNGSKYLKKVTLNNNYNCNHISLPSC